MSDAIIEHLAKTLVKRSTLLSKMYEFHKEGRYSDVNIVCDGRVFKCHRLVLAAASEYFNRMFSGNFVESRASEVTLHDVESAVFEQILHHVYHDETPTIDEGNVFSLLRTSEMLELSDVEDQCAHYLTQKNIPMDCAIGLYLYASTLRKGCLITATARFILQHLDCFCRDTEFLEISFEDFSALLTHFKASSPTRERRTLLNAIFHWVLYNSSDTSEEVMRSRFEELALKASLTSVTHEYLSEFFDSKLADSEDPEGICSLATVDLDRSPVAKERRTIHAYVATSRLKFCNLANSHYLEPRTSIFSLQENGIGWRLSRIIKPRIPLMRTVESDGRLYSLKMCDLQWTFSSSAAVDLSTDSRDLALPTGSFAQTNESLYAMRRHYMSWFSLCELKNYIYLSGLHDDVVVQRYNIEQDVWSPVRPAVSASESDRYLPTNLVSDDTRLYVICESLQGCEYLFVAYDPRDGRVEQLCNAGLNHIDKWTAPACYHKGKIYVPEARDEIKNMLLSTFKTAVYDPAAGRWEVQKCQTRHANFTNYRRLATFNDHLWMLGSGGTNNDYSLCSQSYDSYLGKWDTRSRADLQFAITQSKQIADRLTDVIVFKS